jgi:hypothetical protein
MRRTKGTLLFALCLPLLPAAARAQTTMDLSTIDLGIQQIQQNTFLFDSINRSTATTPGGSTSGSTGTRRPAPAPPTRPGGGGSGQPLAGQTTFRPVAASIVPQRWAWQMGKTPEKRARLEKFFAALLEDYREMAKERGAPLNDVARASSFAAGTSYDVYNEGRMLGERPFRAMREQMYAALAASPKFQTLDDRQRQEMYESYILLGMFVSVMYENAVKDHDPELAARMRRLARIQLEGAFGAPVERLRFTDEGVRF